MLPIRGQMEGERKGEVQVKIESGEAVVKKNSWWMNMPDPVQVVWFVTGLAGSALMAIAVTRYIFNIIIHLAELATLSDNRKVERVMGASFMAFKVSLLWEILAIFLASVSLANNVNLFFRTRRMLALEERSYMVVRSGVWMILGVLFIYLQESLGIFRSSMLAQVIHSHSHC